MKAFWIVFFFIITSQLYAKQEFFPVANVSMDMGESFLNQKSEFEIEFFQNEKPNDWAYYWGAGKGYSLKYSNFKKNSANINSLGIRRGIYLLHSLFVFKYGSDLVFETYDKQSNLIFISFPEIEVGLNFCLIDRLFLRTSVGLTKYFKLNNVSTNIDFDKNIINPVWNINISYLIPMFEVDPTPKNRHGWPSPKNIEKSEDILR